MMDHDVRLPSTWPSRQTNVVELANGGSHHVPDRSTFSEGQYEVVSRR